jgi:ribonuclease P protein component
VQRLKTRSQFQAVLAGQIIARTPHFALHACALAPEPAQEPLFRHADVWMGAMVPKRWARHAATRNAIKRQVYTVSGHLSAQLPQAAHVVRLRVAFDRKQFRSASSSCLKDAVRAELEQLFHKFAATPAGAGA